MNYITMACLSLPQAVLTKAFVGLVQAEKARLATFVCFAGIHARWHGQLMTYKYTYVHTYIQIKLALTLVVQGLLHLHQSDISHYSHSLIGKPSKPS